jgi:hypothetical protein
MRRRRGAKKRGALAGGAVSTAVLAIGRRRGWKPALASLWAFASSRCPAFLPIPWPCRDPAGLFHQAAGAPARPVNICRQ